jgi:uncharacterized protein involved in cysteine biosynthesis
MNGLFRQYKLGLLVPWTGLRVLSQSKKLLLLSLIPMLIGLIFVFVGFFLASEYISPLLESWLDFNKNQEEPLLWFKVLSRILILISWIFIGLFNFFFAYLCILIFASPFYAILVEAIFKCENNNQQKQISLGLSLKLILIGMLKVILFALIGLVCFIVSFIPPVNFFVPFIIYLLIAFDCMDYAFEFETFNLRERFHFFINHIFFFLGLGSAVFLTSLISGAFFILMPIFICGATKMYIQFQAKSV